MSDDTPQAPEVSYYLTCFPAPPLGLDRETPTTIGRAEENTVVLADSTASRRHALVEWKDGDFVVRDLGSRNGTFLNDHRVEESILRSDDRIRVGDHVFTFLAGDERAVSQHFLLQRRKRHSGGTDIIEAPALARPAGGFSGELADFDLAELLQALDLGRKTGRISVASEDLRGEMLLREGRVVGASLGGLEGEDAAYAMLGLKYGTFEFEPREVEIRDGLDASTASLLMEALRRVDEERRAQAVAEEGQGVEGVGAAEAHDPSLDTKHGEEPPPEVAELRAEDAAKEENTGPPDPDGGAGDGESGLEGTAEPGGPQEDESAEAPPGPAAGSEDASEAAAADVDESHPPEGGPPADVDGRAGDAEGERPGETSPE